MKETLAHLLELQEVDNALDELRRARETYPKRIDELRKELEEERTSLEELKGKLQELERQKRHYERELKRAQDELEKHKARLYEVKTNREYDAVQQEIEAWENSIGQNEEFLLDTMAAIEELTPQVADKEQAYVRSRQEKQEEIENLLAKLGTLEEELEGYLLLALEMRRRVKEQLKRMGGIEFWDTRFTLPTPSDFLMLPAWPLALVTFDGVLKKAGGNPVTRLRLLAMLLVEAGATDEEVSEFLSQHMDGYRVEPLSFTREVRQCLAGGTQK